MVAWKVVMRVIVKVYSTVAEKVEWMVEKMGVS